MVQNFFDIAQAYGLIIGTKNRPPTSMEEIKGQLAEIHAAELGGPPERILVSPRDGLPIVVILGVPLDSDAKGTIWAYEQKGVDGQRYVMMLSRDVALLSDEEFAKASFAKGHKPANS